MSRHVSRLENLAYPPLSRLILTGLSLVTSPHVRCPGGTSTIACRFPRSCHIAYRATTHRTKQGAIQSHRHLIRLQFQRVFDSPLVLRLHICTKQLIRLSTTPEPHNHQMAQIGASQNRPSFPRRAPLSPSLQGRNAAPPVQPPVDNWQLSCLACLALAHGDAVWR